MEAVPNPWTTLLPALVVGIGVGLFFFGGLWLTVRRLPRAANPWLWVVGSFAVRSAAALLGFFWVAGERWTAWLACLLGFLLSRGILVRQARMQTKR